MEEQKTENNKKTKDKIVDLNPNILIIIINVNDLSIPIKRDCLMYENMIYQKNHKQTKNLTSFQM